jgi:hypothetical protein
LNRPRIYGATYDLWKVDIKTKKLNKTMTMSTLIDTEQKQDRTANSRGI